MNDHSKLVAYSNAPSAIDGYDQKPKPGLPTYTEAWALIEAARRMAISSDVAKDLNDKETRTRVRDAIRLNWRLWTIFQAELSTEDENIMPVEIRGNMLNLCRFIDTHTVDTLKNPTPENITTLIDINRNIAGGLLDSLQNTLQEDAKKEAANKQEPLQTDDDRNDDADQYKQGVSTAI